MIAHRLQQLRQRMREEHLGAFIFPSEDPHQSEYVPNRWKAREWISGFNGSAGTAVVTLKSAALWTDSRYFIAAAEQLQDTEFTLQKQGLEETPSIVQWIGEQLRDADSTEVGIDGSCISQHDAEELIAGLRRHGGLTLRTNLDIVDTLWTDRPEMPSAKIVMHPEEFAGESAASKLQRIRRALRHEHADGLFVSALDDIAWTLNLRGSDVKYNPVFVAYLLIEGEKATLFADRQKITAEVQHHLAAIHVDIKPYKDAAKGLTDYFEYNIMVDPQSINTVLYQAARKHKLVLQASPIPQMKSRKNEVEMQGFRSAMLKDGVALSRFLCWLEKAVPQGGISELRAAEKLEQFKQETDDYRGPSFETISAYGPHGAIVHYEPTEQTDAELKSRGFLLLDCGSQYPQGTTDVTRTIPLGELSEKERQIYTLVLKAHIQLELAVFPEGACGSQIDALARLPLWRAGLNFRHGTGHGVGAYLNVHEGPHQVRQEWRPAPLTEHMTITDEPGIYLEGEFGVRIENTLITQVKETTPFGTFLNMEPLTLCPISLKPVILEWLTPEEKQWLNSYHAMVRERIEPFLSGEERIWLQQATLPV